MNENKFTFITEKEHEKTFLRMICYDVYSVKLPAKKYHSIIKDRILFSSFYCLPLLVEQADNLS